MKLEQLNDWLWCLRTEIVQAFALSEGDGFNLIDTSTSGNENIILELLGNVAGCAPDEVRISEILITHGHADHFGSAAAIVAQTGARVIAPLLDAPFITGQAPWPAPQLLDWEVPIYQQVMPKVPGAPPVVPDRLVGDGDTLNWEHNATLLAVPGHTPGSIAAWFEKEQALVAGDAIALFDGRPIVGAFNVDPAAAADSFRRLAHLDAELACYGHGDAIRTQAGVRLAEASRLL